MLHHPSPRSHSARAAVVLVLAFSVANAARAATAPDVARARRVDAAVERAVDYYKGRRFVLQDPAIAMVLTLLGERFPGQVDVPAREVLTANLPVLARKQFQIGSHKFHDRGYPIDPPLEYAAWIYGSYRQQIDALTDLAVECQRYPLPRDFVPTLRNQLMKGGYAMTHVGLQLANAVENGCLPRNQETTAFSRDVSGYLRDAIGNEQYSRDVRIEAITLLLHLGATAMLTPADIDWVLNLQRPDGGWLAAVDSTASHEHTTALALWALLEWRERVPQA